ncbi:hypothetical protein BDB00DRAFT_57522 [Zychaea mexicana]|uniref:uncharacterized protein n=1 Tax=Zychaea mexicana TaxID=64656 RepID=UPI0022FE28DB|nr:uncharacterized protein BDB00DRAFT_57522 [Zychaea mexicana]KAI9488330.1 hypothetical protein BDB00DRAFT_57522 [Zychaea mexicana]
MKRLTPTPTPSVSNLSFRSNTSRNSNYEENRFAASKEECHARAERTVDEWSECLKMMLRYSDPSDEFNKTIKRFVQTDSHAKNTRQALEKTSKALDQLLEKKQDILATTKIFEEIQDLLELKQVVRENWAKQQQQQQQQSQ